MATNVQVETPLGIFEIELFDDEAPANVENFLNYVNDGDFENSFIHRSIPGFVIQGGAFVFEDNTATAIESDPPVVNEFGRSNVRGTVAMAKLADDPNSATSSWFINLADNSANLDNQNEGFTVIGEVVGDGMSVVDAIADLQVWNAGGAFSDLPLIDYPGDGSNITSDQLVFTQVSVVPSGANLEIDASFSGAWYDPTHDGEGFLVEILDGAAFGVEGRVALVYWFTYNPQGEQAWMVGLGQVVGNRVEFTEALRPVGARFGPAFDPDDVDRTVWGSFTIEFNSCDSASMSYQGPWGAGSQDLIRLWSIDGVDCGQTARKVLGGSLTGAWFDPDRDGEGFLIDVIGPNTAVVYWFTYDNQGNQFWIVGVGEIDRNSVVITDSDYTRGGLFGDNFDPDTVERIPWGAMAFSFSPDGVNATMRYQGPGDFGEGGYFLTRLSQLSGQNVLFDQNPRQVSVTGVAASNQVLDGDVNDPNVPLRANNTPGESQPVPNPVVITGFATRDPTSDGRFSDSADEFDAYRLSLSRDQILALTIADFDAGAPAAVDLDLLLYRAGDASAPILSSESVSAREELVVPETGEFDVVVRAFAGTSSYGLTVANTSALPSGQKLHPMQDWVSGEVVVTLADGGKAATLKALTTTLNLQQKAGAADRELLLSLDKSSGEALLAREKSAFHRTGFGVPLDDKRRDLLQIKHLAAQPGVSAVEPNYRYHASAEPNDSAYSFQWHYPAIRLPQAWEVTRGSSDVVVAVLDTGVTAHPDNQDNLAAGLGADLISDRFNANDGGGIDLDATDPGDLQGANSSSFHGTHVAGTVGASTNNSIGGGGVAWDVTVMPIRVLGTLGGTSFDIIQGIRFAAGLANDLGQSPSRTADILNMSLGGSGFSQQTQNVLSQVRDRGIIVIAAAGNESTSQLSYPASYDGVVSVSASTIVDDLAAYSNFGSAIDLAAPGGETATDFNGDGQPDGVLSNLFRGQTPTDPIIGFYQGTSMATPHVAGVVALMKSVYPGLTPAELDQAIASGEITVDVAGDGPGVRNDGFGYGRIDALKAVQWAQALGGGSLSQPVLAPSSGILSFGASTSELPLELSNAGQGNLQITATSSSQPWLSVTPDGTDSDGLGRYLVRVDRSGLVNSRYQGTVTFLGSQDTRAEVSVKMDVGDVEVPGEAGTVYVLLVDPLTSRAADQFVLAPGNRYPVAASLLPGDYYVVAGTDIDNDGFICDDGELCGAWPTLAEIQVISVEQDNLDLGEFVIAPLPARTSTAAKQRPLTLAPLRRPIDKPQMR
ncbi:MAG: S8 family serine peptidase [Xanthomonadales bacterium]|nr:S8 family serine peptidase [Xanthomonadales bacterium]